MKILIVEDEVLIADMLERYLVKKGYEVVGSAISYQEAVVLLEQHKVDLALLDIRLNGPKTGIDLAQYIAANYPEMLYIYLSSQMDKTSIDAAKSSFPVAFLTKPIQKESLYATIEIVMHNQLHQQKAKKIFLQLGQEGKAINIDDILFLEAEHVYVKIYLEGQPPFLVRQALKELKLQLPKEIFKQSHRSFLVNIRKIERWDRNNLYIQDYSIPISRSKKEEFFKLLKEEGE